MSSSHGREEEGSLVLKGLLVPRDQEVRYLLVWGMSLGHWFQSAFWRQPGGDWRVTG